ncbi:hypothetical protein EV2_006990 [Malus domestica]
MPGINPEIACHKVYVDPATKPMIQKRRHFAPERVVIIEAEIDKLLEARFIEEVAHLAWLANVDLLVDSTSRNQLLSFLDAYSGYNQIAIYELNKEKTAILIKRGTYY